jgi:hypothetical protein
MKNTIIQKFIAGAMVLGMMMAMAPMEVNAQFTTVWERNDRTGAEDTKPSWFGAGTERGIAYYNRNGNHRLYVASRNGGNTIRVLNADTGEDVTLDTAFDLSSVSGGTFAINDINVSSDGAIVVGNLATGSADGPFKAYIWDSEGGAPVHTFSFGASEYTVSPQRLGDKFTVKGSWSEGTIEIWTPVASTSPGRIYVHKTTNQGATWETELITLSGAYTGMGANMDVEPLAAGRTSDFYISGNGTQIRRHNSSGAYVSTSLMSSVSSSQNGLASYNNGTTQYLFTYQYRELVNNTDAAIGFANIFNVTTAASWSNLGSSPKLSSTGSGNHINGDITVRSFGDGTFVVYALGTVQGIIAYGYNTIEPSRQISGDAGWRMLAAPASGKTVGDLASQNLIQGVTGGTHASADPNIFTSHNGTDWQVPASTSTVLTPGTGFIWYMFNNTSVSESVALPFTLNLVGTEPDADVTVSVHSDGNKFNLLGNPFNSSIDVTALTADGDFTAGVQVWADGTGESAGGASVAGSWVVESSRVAPFQGFMLENDTATEITIPTSAKSTGGVFHKGTESVSIDLSLTAFNDAGNAQVVDRAARLVLNAGAGDGWDRYDMTKLGSLDPVAGLLYFVGERNGEVRSKAQESRNIEFDHYEIPLDVVRYSGNGAFRVSWTPLESIPDNWSVQLVNNETNEIVDMRSATFHDFQAAASKSVTDREIGTPVAVSGGADSRFKLVLSQGETTDIHQSQLVERIALSQNYPNPFNPTTRISFELPSSQFVKLSVFNMLGQEVSTLLQTEMNAGSHFVNFDASQLSSGVYVYRLEAGGQVITRKMTLVK